MLHLNGMVPYKRFRFFFLGPQQVDLVMFIQPYVHTKLTKYIIYCTPIRPNIVTTDR